MKIGAVFPQIEAGTDIAAITEYINNVESLGFDHILAFDHVLGANASSREDWPWPYQHTDSFYEPITFYSYVAGITNNLELATGVVILPQRQTALVAKQAAEVAILSNNRLRLGVGTGWNEVEYDALGVPFTQRGKRQEEQIELLRLLWSEDSLVYTGDYHRVEYASINPRPSKPIPIWFGGQIPKVLSRAAKIGDGWMPLGAPNAASSEMIEHLKQARTDAGRSWSDFGIQAQAMFRGGDPERYAKHAQGWRTLGATHLAIRTDSCGYNSIDEHLKSIEAYVQAIS